MNLIFIKKKNILLTQFSTIIDMIKTIIYITKTTIYIANESDFYQKNLLT